MSPLKGYDHGAVMGEILAGEDHKEFLQSSQILQVLLSLQIYHHSMKRLNREVCQGMEDSDK